MRKFQDFLKIISIIIVNLFLLSSGITSYSTASFTDNVSNAFMLKTATVSSEQYEATSNISIIHNFDSQVMELVRDGDQVSVSVMETNTEESQSIESQLALVLSLEDPTTSFNLENIEVYQADTVEPLPATYKEGKAIYRLEKQTIEAKQTLESHFVIQTQDNNIGTGILRIQIEPRLYLGTFYKDIENTTLTHSIALTSLVVPDTVEMIEDNATLDASLDYYDGDEEGNPGESIQSVTEIEFTLEPFGTYKAEKGMTFEEWIASDYCNQSEFVLWLDQENGNRVVLNTESKDVGFTYQDEEIVGSSMIQENVTYISFDLLEAEESSEEIIEAISETNNEVIEVIHEEVPAEQNPPLESTELEDSINNQV